MNIEVKVDEVSLTSIIREGYEDNNVTIGDRVVEAIVNRLADEHDYWGALRERVNSIRSEEIRAAVGPQITEALSQPFRKSTSYGEPTGPEVTLRELIVQEVRDYLGKPVGNGYDRAGKTAIAKLVADEVDKAFKAEVADAVKEVRESVAKQFGDSISERFAAVAREALRSR